MTTSFAPLTVALGDLTAHPANVRSNSPETYDPENIAHLKASIAVLGLLQPLLVQKIDGKYAVLAGGRRHAALKELVADKAAKGFTAKTKVDCRLVPEECDVTTALSLAENITQAPMNAIDEFEAFARMMEVDGQTPETIAKTFGTTVAAVKGRLRYGLIHPDIRAAARAKVITLDTMKAFAEHARHPRPLEAECGALQPLQEGLAPEDPRRGSGSRPGGGDAGLVEQEGDRRLLRQALRRALRHAHGRAARCRGRLVPAHDADRRCRL